MDTSRDETGMYEHDPWLERLSEYLDGALDDAEREALEVHLGHCLECRATLEELRAVIAMAESLEDRMPERDLWPDIAARIEAARRGREVVDLMARKATTRRRISISITELVAAGITIALLSGGTAWLLRPRTASTEATRPAIHAEWPDAPSEIRFAANPGGPRYDAAVAELERILDEGRERLDPKTIATLETNLALIDAAIEEARRAIAEDPANEELNHYIADQMKRKVEILRFATMIVRAEI